MLLPRVALKDGFLMKKFTLSALMMILAVSTAFAAPRPMLDAAQLQLALRKLNVVGSALYVAAHPDDENTALLAYLANEKLVRTTYLSITRGDGGQNLIGSEKGDLLGLIRTEELLAARRIDRAEQRFTRAVDFGYSKTPDETLSIWGKNEILSDVVLAIRQLQPDVIVTRFPTNGDGGHGHHTASALLALEAFTAAADPARFPEQLRMTKTWQARRILWNVFRRDPSLPLDPKLVSIDLGQYSPLLGRSYTELAGESRSMHKSQGFGAPERRGSLLNQFHLVAGEPLTSDLLEGVDLSWGRIAGGEEIGRILAQASRDFNPEKPSAVLPLLVKAYALISRISENPGVEAKRLDLLEVIRSAAGLWLEAIASSPTGTVGGDVKVTVTAINRSEAPLRVQHVGFSLSPDLIQIEKQLSFNQPVRAEYLLKLPALANVSQPYWLRFPTSKGLFTVRERALIGTPINDPAVEALFLVTSGETTLPFRVPLQYRWVDRVKGEQYRPFVIVPDVTIGFDQPFYIFPDARPKRALLTVTSHRDTPFEGRVKPKVPAGWTLTPQSVAVSLQKKGERATAEFLITPSAAESSGSLSAVVEVGERLFGRGLISIAYDHIPLQTLFSLAETKLVRADVKRTGQRIGYVMGPGDEVPEALRQIGYTVSMISDEELAGGDLTAYDSIVVGVRAYNSRQGLKQSASRLHAYVENGGTVVVQYNTADDTLFTGFSPLPLKVSRDRVTVEEAPVTLIDPDHPLLSTPNRITEKDFAGWVQERGLYFANEWDPKFTPLLASNDPGEESRKGGLLVARHGKGLFIYTGYAFFRQLPAGVPGAYRLFANLVSAE